ncbi:hypothetical protein AUC43_02600 [Hymenobacter sedentarius]|uniref:Uncharacterized protein n=1 Tax=Hymenobacter sedentarius TaxID=1411621 RepID=A0A0U4AKR5_9BACT|nr:hypothetical protein [Hymenobacter sedentarius]ALW84085.1 hypothetical protein AUC43_02600 [Hymenobacter sedentarius]
MRILPALGFALLSLTVFSCKHSDSAVPCYSGVVVGDACMDGILIDVDAASAIGKPTGNYTNVIAAVNFADLSSLSKVGQRVYFTYRNDPSQQTVSRFCTANSAPLPVPHFVLSNLSVTSCKDGATH